MIKINNARKLYTDQLTIRPLYIEITKAGFTSLIGPNTVRQLAGFERFPYSKGRLTNEDEAIISKYIDFLDLPDLEHRYLDELSGGQRQRANVAMVLCQETEYVLLEE